MAEGFIRTRSRARYARRLLVVALVSEVPFDLLAAGRPVYPLRQNVLWTFLIALGCMQLLEWAKAEMCIRDRIAGEPLPVVTCQLAAGETMITERGSMSWMTPNMRMETTTNGGLGKAFGRLLAGEALFQNRYTAQGGPGLIAFASSFPGKMCIRDSFCMMKPSPPKKPEPSFFWKKTESSTPASAAKKMCIRDSF